MNTARLNADEFFKGHEDCIREKESPRSYNVSLIPSDEEYPIILEEANMQMNDYGSLYGRPDYERMKKFVNTHFKGLTYDGYTIQDKTITELNVYRNVISESWLFVYKGVSYIAEIADGLICTISLYDSRVEEYKYNSTIIEISPLTTLDKIADESLAMVRRKKADEIKEFKKSLFELRKNHKEIMKKYEDVLNGKEINK